MSSDILIIGGGVIGLSIARELHKRGAGSITVLDKGRIGAEASWAAAGMLAPNAECRANDELFRLCTASKEKFPELAAELFEETGIDIELDRTGTISVAFSEAEGEVLDANYEWQKKAEVSVQKLSAAEVRELEPEISPGVHRGYLYPSDWQVENRKLVAALRRYCEMNGIELMENTDVSGLIIEGGVVKGAEALGRELHAHQVILTAGAWSTDVHPAPEIKPIRGQMISLAGPLPRILHRVICSPRGYIVPRLDGRVLVGATVEDVAFRKEVTPEAIQLLKAAAVEIAPGLDPFAIAEAWAGLRPFIEGELPVIGRVPDVENAFVATGHYRNGILLAPITAKMIANQVFGAQLGVPQFGGTASIGAEADNLHK